jgi:hypothetical protein
VGDFALVIQQSWQLALLHWLHSDFPPFCRIQSGEFHSLTNTEKALTASPKVAAPYLSDYDLQHLQKQKKTLTAFAESAGCFFRSTKL